MIGAPDVLRFPSKDSIRELLGSDPLLKKQWQKMPKLKEAICELFADKVVNSEVCWKEVHSLYVKGNPDWNGITIESSEAADLTQRIVASLFNIGIKPKL